jgi:hypothetical protein
MSVWEFVSLNEEKFGGPHYEKVRLAATPTAESVRGVNQAN